MNEHLGAAQCMGTGDFGIDDLLAGDGGEVADLGSRDGKHPVDAIDVKILGPHVVRGRCEHRIEAAVAQDDRARRGNDEARLEIQAREMGVDFIGVAREEHPLGRSDGPERRIFGAVDLERGLVGEIGNPDPSGEARQQIFGQDDEAQPSIERAVS